MIARCRVQFAGAIAPFDLSLSASAQGEAPMAWANTGEGARCGACRRCRGMSANSVGQYPVIVAPVIVAPVIVALAFVPNIDYNNAPILV